MRILRHSTVSLTTVLAAHAALAAAVPQLDRTWYPNQLLWLAVSFGLLYAVVARFITPTIRKVMATREEAIGGAIREAERAKQAAETTRGKFESEGHQARGKAAEFMAQAQAQSSREAAEAMAKLDHEIARKNTLAETRITAARDQALATMGDATAELASVMAAKLLDGGDLKTAAKRPLKVSA